MEGVGSRLGRTSSRYGPSASAAVFNGPVRKWKKKWVHVSPSPSSNAGNHSSHSHSNGVAGNSNNNSRLLLCRWTPLSSTAAAAASVDTPSEEPPRRKFRYTPMVVLEEQKKAAKKVDHEVRTSREFSPLRGSKNDDLNLDDATFKTETQDSNTSSLDLGLCLKGHNSNSDSIGQRKEDQAKKAASGGFWTTG
ncbi:hypothetical protein M5689_014384 [Euphorbia peplus]|nr:hypothetical protein M5689_014384 [Euphorbia peplus]